jgi:hypothetical protein
MKQSSAAVKLAEEVLQELVWLCKDHNAEERERRTANRSAGQQESLDRALQPFELLKLVLRLKAERAFSHARQILQFLRTSQVTEPELRRVYQSQGGESASTDRYTRAALRLASDTNLQLRIAQQHSVCTYKDSNLPARRRLESALEILNSADNLAITQDQETLGQAGAIHNGYSISTGKENISTSHFDFIDVATTPALKKTTATPQSTPPMSSVLLRIKKRSPRVPRVFPLLRPISD